MVDLNDGTASDTMSYKVKVRDKERPVIGDLEAITIGKDDTLSVENLGKPKFSDNVAVNDTTFKVNYKLISQTLEEEVYDAIGYVKDVFGNDTTHTYQTVTKDLTVGVDDEGPLVNRFDLYQNYPNPFNPTTTITFSVPHPPLFLGGLSASKSQNVSLKVYNVLGKEVATLVNETKPVGRYSINFNATDLPSGIYFYRLQSGKFAKTKQMLLLK
ncbi:MAG: T9SS type A sorting domain-containing protein [Ignavibacteriae bacterium]|nr:T9SS type A sorting domain-containing protein [Ignavibacteriota bacterium]